MALKRGAKWDAKVVEKMDAILDENMVLMRMPFRKQKRTLAMMQNMKLFRKKPSTLFRKQSWMLFWKKKNRRYFGCHKGCYLGRKKDVF